jgi:predicted  nucleic acid-binding Zn-ribbon protein
LHRYEREHNGDSDTEVEVGKTGNDVTEAVVVDEDGEYTIEVEEEQTIDSSVG